MANGFSKIYSRTYWVNNTPPAINEINLNNLENGVNSLDDRVVALDATKLDQSTANTMVKDVTFDETTGIFTVTKLNGSTLTIDTKLEKITTNWTFDKVNQKLVLTLDDGTTQEVDLSELITQYEFLESDTVVFVIDADGNIKADIKKGSITGDLLETNYLANITIQAGKAEASANAAAQSASDADYDAKLAQSYSVGGSGIRTGEDTDNAKYYKEQAELSATSASDSATSASTSATTASEAAQSAQTSAESAALSAEDTALDRERCEDIVRSIYSAVDEASDYAYNASQSAASASTYMSYAQEYALDAQDYMEQAERIAEGLGGTLIPMGTITFAELSDTSKSGYLYNISDEFTTTARFKEGSGHTIPAGSNVFYTADGYWDVLAGSPVTGIKGSAESSYRRGNVNITPANIGLGNVPNVSTNNQTPTYTTSTSLTALASGEKLSVAFGKIAKAVTDLISHLVDTVSHITALERTAWNNAKDKADVTNIAYGTCTTAGNAAEKVVTLEGNDNWLLKKGAIIMVKFANTSSATNVTLNVNGTGAKQIWYAGGVFTGNNGYVNGESGRHCMYIYDGTYWVWVSHGYEVNTTYTNQSLGQGYATCTTAAATTAKVATLSGYGKTLGGIVAVKFTYDVPANATLNINSRGASAIYYRGSAITAGVIKAGNTATFMYDGSYYQLLTIDKLTASDVGAVSIYGDTIDGRLSGKNGDGDETWYIDEDGWAQLVRLNGTNVPANPKFTDTVVSVTNGHRLKTLTINASAGTETVLDTISVANGTYLVTVNIRSDATFTGRWFTRLSEGDWMLFNNSPTTINYTTIVTVTNGTIPINFMPDNAVSGVTLYSDIGIIKLF